VIRIERLGWDAIGTYESVPIAFSASVRVDLDWLERTGEVREVACEPFVKDYDALERPSCLPERFNVSDWLLFGAFADSQLVGGAILAALDNQAWLWDIRVAFAWRGCGVGRELFSAVRVSSGLLRVETQDVNVAACRFYAAMGCRVESVHRDAYLDCSGEAKIVWLR